jgi:predicted NAD/FAD-binding protein
MKIAVIGTGISGMLAAYLLHDEHEITVFEANDYIGGHTNTIDVKTENGTFPVDTGFIVFNQKTYPNFVKLLRRLNVPWQESKMSFSVHCEKTGIEYSPTSLSTLFAQRRNILRPWFFNMIREVFAFRKHLANMAELDENITLEHYLREENYSRKFADYFVIPMGAAIWSAEPEGFKDFPACMFARFFLNHGFLNVYDQPQWLVIKGGSREYANALTSSFGERIRTGCRIKEVARFGDRVEVTDERGNSSSYDHVIIATHSDQALEMLSDPTEAESEVLGSIPYQKNEAVLHTDISLLPDRRRIWSSWNYLIPSEVNANVAVTYDMNILQTLEAGCEFCVTLNQRQRIDASKIVQILEYCHPAYRPCALGAQKRYREISGLNRTHYCGAYWGNGFHEDGVNSALAACEFFGKSLDE